MKITHEDYKEDLQNLKKSYIVEMSIKDLEDYLGDMTRDYKHFTEEVDRIEYIEGFIESLVDNFGRKRLLGENPSRKVNEDMLEGLEKYIVKDTPMYKSYSIDGMKLTYTDNLLDSEDMTDEEHMEIIRNSKEINSKGDTL